MFKYILVLAWCCAGAWSVPSGTLRIDIDHADQLFEEFVVLHQKQYKNENERQMRFGIFKDNLERINKLIMKSKTAEFGINKFTDITREEVHQHYTGYRNNDRMYPNDKTCSPAEDKDTPLPTQFDWRDKNKVSGIKDQGRCGSCWAFSAVGNLEGQYAIKHNQLKEFSEQQLVDCDLSDYGCGGGLMQHAFLWLKDHGGIESEEDYPYTAKDGKCSFNKTKVQATVSGCISVDATDEQVLQRALVNYGPLAIGVDAMALLDYKGGILDNCEGESLNHGVLLIGYGKANGTDFWIIKNSWGKDWGEKGFVRVQMNKNCLLMTEDVSSAVVD